MNKDVIVTRVENGFVLTQGDKSHVATNFTDATEKLELLLMPESFAGGSTAPLG